MLFALLAVLAPAVLSWVAYRGVREALTAQFERRLENVAAATANQISPEDIANAALLGEDGTGYGNLQVQLEALRATTSLANAALFDSSRALIYDCRGPEYFHDVTRLDSLVHDDVTASLAGASLVSRPFVLGGASYRAGLVPVHAPGGRVAGVVQVEAIEDYLPVLDHFRRSLLLTWVILSVAIGSFALLRVRQARAAERLERRLARSETLAAMGRLTATLAHEIKNPLAIIRGSAERLGKLEPEARRMADFVVEESDRLSRTVARYLEFARGRDDAGGDGDALEALDATLALLEGEAEARRVTLARDPGEPGPHPVALDNESLKQIYLNLILNAMEAMPEGGRIAIRHRTIDGRLEIRVTDQGPGFTPEQLKTLGTPFLTTKARGSGLGLFLSRRLAQSAGGDLRLGNAAEGGAECVLVLPMKRRP